ncbi:MAG TPA: Glu/Leu/Phe/Val dehydrogenase dimerization domain-containing protein [Jiangellaceae bacterium]
MAAEPQEPLLRVTWTDPVTFARGYCVVDRLVGDIATGGTRMRPGCTLTEVEDLARGMTAKAGVFELPVGGAKGGIDYDPSAPDARDVLARFVAAMRPLLNDCWVTAEDLGISQTMLDEVFAEAGLGMSLNAAIVRSANPDATLRRVREAFTVDADGVALPDMVGGFGVAEAAVGGLNAIGRDPEVSRAVVQGFGSMGGSTARYLARRGVCVVGIADRHGLLLREDGLDVEAMLAARTPFGDIDRAAVGADVKELPGAEWLAQDVDLLVPAAVSYAITTENAPFIKAPLIVSAANVPATPDAEAMLLDRGVAVLPDFVANGGAAAWAWWTLYGEVDPTPDSAFAKLAAEMAAIVAEVLAVSERDGVTGRDAALAISRRNHDRFDAELDAGAPPKPIV